MTMQEENLHVSGKSAIMNWNAWHKGNISSLHAYLLQVIVRIFITQFIVIAI